MTRTAFDFARPRVPGRWKWLVAAMVLVVATVVATGAARSRAAYMEALKQLRAASEQSLVVSLPAAKPRPVQAHFGSALELLAERTVPWPAILAVLESVDWDGIKILYVEVDFRSRLALVEVAFTEYPKLFAYLDGLDRGEPGLLWELKQVQTRHAGPVGAVATLVVR